jgi:CheY-like chemotaxis protein
MWGLSLNSARKSDTEPSENTQLEKCRGLIREGKLDDAISCLTDLMLISNSTEVADLLAEAYHRAGESQEAALIQSLPGEKWKSINGHLLQIRVFVFDGDPEVLKFFRRMLDPRSYEVFLFTRSTACQRCPCNQGECCADIMFIDIAMMKNSGLDFLQSQKRKGCKIKNIAMMSDSWKKESIEANQAMGFMTFQKPVIPEEINLWLDECEKKIDPNRTLSDYFFEPTLPAAPINPDAWRETPPEERRPPSR